MRYKGSCHCQAVAFEVEGDLSAVVSCNCSICQRKGALLWAVPLKDLHMKRGGDALARYTFNSNAIVHRFCRTCGMQPFAEQAGTDGGSAYINIRCIDDIDLKALEVLEFDGRSA